jgi:hypothetical protein
MASLTKVAISPPTCEPLARRKHPPIGPSASGGICKSEPYQRRFLFRYHEPKECRAIERHDPNWTLTPARMPLGEITNSKYAGQLRVGRLAF